MLTFLFSIKIALMFPLLLAFFTVHDGREGEKALYYSRGSG
jgi:hypothetical protein